jgi:CO/xanthine dehydrogenase Mo-binding subunit
MDSAVVFGLTAALYGEVTLEAGQVLQSNFHDQPLLRWPTARSSRPTIMPSTEPPEGVGEPGTPPIAPAVANALFALTGQRLRAPAAQLPLAVNETTHDHDPSSTASPCRCRPNPTPRCCGCCAASSS